MLDITLHFFLSLVVGFVIWKIWGGRNKKLLFWCLVVALLAGVFIDVDHLFDYYMAYGWHFNVNLFFAKDYFDINHRNYVLFHGFEYVLLLSIAANFVKGRAARMLLSIAAVSMLVHLWTDIALFSIPPQNYFLIYRILTGFRIS